MASKFVSVPQAGRMLGRSPRSIQRLIDRGTIRAITIPGTHARIEISEVERFVPSQLVITNAIHEVVRLALPQTV